MRPGVAKDYTISKDRTIYTFHLRHNVRWSDGRPVTSRDFLFAYKRLLDPSSGSRAAEYFFIIKGAKDYALGKIKDFSHVGIQTSDPYTITFKLNAPAPYFLKLLGYAAFMPLPEHIVKKYGKKWIKHLPLVSNGPYIITVYKTQDRLVMQKNPFYWNKNNVHIDRVIFYFLNDPEIAYQWFKAGKIQWMKGTLSASLIRKLRAQNDPMLHIDPYLCTYYLAPNLSEDPIIDKNLRLAIAFAIDRDVFSHLFGGAQESATSFVPSSIKFVTDYQPPKFFKFDIHRARKYLKQYTMMHKDMPILRLITNSGAANPMIAQYVAQQVKKNLGITIAIQIVPWKDLLLKIKKRDFDLARASWCADFPDPINFLAIFTSHSPNNYTGWSDSKYDKMINQAIITRDLSERNGIMQKAEQYLLENGVVIPLYFYTRVYLLDPKVKGFKPNLMDRHPIMYLNY